MTSIVTPSQVNQGCQNSRYFVDCVTEEEQEAVKEEVIVYPEGKDPALAADWKAKGNTYDV